MGQNLEKYFQSKNKKTKAVFLRDGNWKEKFFPNTDAIIHLAGKSHDIKNAALSAEYFQVNTELTKKIFDFFLLSPIRDFIFLSSVKAVTDRVDGVLGEEVIPDPHTIYGQSKLKAEEYILSKYPLKEKRIFILRPCMIHGPGNKGNLNLLYKMVKKGIPYPLAAFENRRSFLSISNLLFIIDQILSNPAVPGGIYNVADDEPLSTIDVINIIGEGGQIKPRIWKISPTVIKAIAQAGNKLHFPLNSDRLKKLTESYVVSNQKIKGVLDICSLRVSSRDGLLETIKSFGR